MESGFLKTEYVKRDGRKKAASRARTVGVVNFGAYRRHIDVSREVEAGWEIVRNRLFGGVDATVSADRYEPSPPSRLLPEAREPTRLGAATREPRKPIIVPEQIYDEVTDVYS